MAASSPVSVALGKLSYLLDCDKQVLGGLRAELEAGQQGLEDMQNSLIAAMKYSYDPTVDRLLTVIQGYAGNIKVAIDSDFLNFMSRRRSVFEKMLSVFCGNVDESKDRIVYVLNNIEGIKAAHMALANRVFVLVNM